jgi:hypothetical protein
MLAVPYRAELRSRAIGAGAGILLAFAVATGMIALAGRLDDLNLHWLDAVAVPVAVLIAAAFYTGRRRRLREQLARPRQLGDAVERVAPARVRWLRMAAKGLVAGLVLGGISLVLDFEVDNLAVVLAIALGGVLGDDAAGAAAVARYEREHGGTVYRLEDPPGTEAGLGRLPGLGE